LSGSLGPRTRSRPPGDRTAGADGMHGAWGAGATRVAREDAAGGGPAAARGWVEAPGGGWTGGGGGWLAAAASAAGPLRTAGGPGPGCTAGGCPRVGRLR